MQKHGNEIIEKYDGYGYEAYSGKFSTDFYEVFEESYFGYDRDKIYEKIGSISDLQDEMEFKLAVAEQMGYDWEKLDEQASGRQAHRLYRALKIRGFLLTLTLILWGLYAFLKYRVKSHDSAPKPAEKFKPAFCPQCGAAITGPARFCARCGEPIVPAGAGPAAPAPGVPISARLADFAKAAGAIAAMAGSKLKEWAVAAAKALGRFAAEVKARIEAKWASAPKPAPAPRPNPPIGPNGQNGGPGVACPKCGRLYPAGQRFCTACGSKLNPQPQQQPERMICPGCGRAVPAGAKFCSGCGHRVE